MISGILWPTMGSPIFCVIATHTGQEAVAMRCILSGLVVVDSEDDGSGPIGTTGGRWPFDSKHLYFSRIVVFTLCPDPASSSATPKPHVYPPPISLHLSICSHPSWQLRVYWTSVVLLLLLLECSLSNSVLTHKAKRPRRKGTRKGKERKRRKGHEPSELLWELTYQCFKGLLCLGPPISTAVLLPRNPCLQRISYSRRMRYFGMAAPPSSSLFGFYLISEITFSSYSTTTSPAEPPPPPPLPPLPLESRLASLSASHSAQPSCCCAFGGPILIIDDNKNLLCPLLTFLPPQHTNRDTHTERSKWPGH